MMRILQTSMLCLLAVSGLLAGESKHMPADGPKGFTWDSPVPDDCPFPQSTSLTGIFFTGRHSDYRCGDTWYPSWASDGNLYSPWTDGTTDGVASDSGAGLGAKTGHAVMIGDDPLRLTIRNTSPPQGASALPYKGRYPAGSLVYNGVWYYGTYCLGPDGSYKHNGFVWNWPNLGPMPGFQISRDYGKTWEPSPHTPEKPLFPEPRRFLGPVKMGAPHFVDFGQNMAHSPDGKAYVLGMGAEENDAKPRPCIKPGKPGEVFQMVEGCAADFAHANLSWITADQVYLARVKPSPETINDLRAWEFFAGHDGAGQPVWTNRFDKIKPLLEWNNHMGCVTATYVPGLKKYLMCVTDGWPTVAKMTSYILEADTVTGPWRRVCYMKDFGEQGYFLNFPSKFISADGRTLWLCYSANFSPGWNGVKLEINPPGGRYGLCLHEVRILRPREAKVASAGSYRTRFYLDEDPISEGGKWINGAKDGMDWHNVITKNGVAYGAVSRGQYTDPTALLTGTWGRNQTVRAKVFSRHQTEKYYQEVEIRLRSTLTRQRCTGYEVFWRCLKTKDAYVEVVRWNGKVGDWTSLKKHTGPQYGVEDGDLVEATIVGNVIKGYINGVEVISATDNTYSAGNPGMGFNFGVGQSNVDFGFSYYEVDSFND